MSTYLWGEDCGDTPWTVVVEEDGDVAYAYLLRDQKIVSHVWLYNAHRNSSKQELAALVAADVTVRPLRFEVSVRAIWREATAERVVVEIWLYGRLHACLSSDSSPGWCRLAKTDGPLALAPPPDLDSQSAALLPSRMETFVHEVASLHPALADDLRVHLGDDGELLPHVYFGDVVRFVEASTHARAERPDDFDAVTALLERIEDCLQHAGPDVLDLLHASFLEPLSYEPDVFAVLKPLFGPRLRHLARSHRG